MSEAYGEEFWQLPRTIQKTCVLDRSLEEGSSPKSLWTLRAIEGDSDEPTHHDSQEVEGQPSWAVISFFLFL
jgi:hypothetical protein